MRAYAAFLPSNMGNLLLFVLFKTHIRKSVGSRPPAPARNADGAPSLVRRPISSPAGVSLFVIDLSLVRSVVRRFHCRIGVVLVEARLRDRPIRGIDLIL